MIDLKEFNIDETILAHTPDETLIAHSVMTDIYFKKIKKEKNLDNLIDKLFLNLDKEYFKLIKEMFDNAIYLHDIGKVNPYFQANKMNNPKFEKEKGSSLSSEHAVFSKIEYLKYFEKKVDKITSRKQKDKLKFILYNFSYHISKHHGKLSIFEEYDEKCISFFHHIKKYKIEPFEFYILNKLLFSLLVSSDYYATTDYMADLSTTNFGTIKDEQKIINLFEKYDIIKNIRNNKNTNGINKLRSKIFLEAEKNLLENINKNIFYLEAPTGSGKTLSSINLAMKLLEKKDEINKIFYVFPFNTLVEQTKKQLEMIFTDNLNIEVINSITPIKESEDENQENEESKYQKSYMSRLFFHNELILTTHIAFFNILFGTTKEDNFPLWQLANSVIIIDEIQSYDINLWSYMTKFFKYYAKALNMKIIIMSATLPKLDELIEEDNTIFEELIKNKEVYFKDNYFKNRVDINFSLLNIKDIENKHLIEKLEKEKNKYSKIVFEFIKKDSAREFYNLLNEDIKFNEFNIYELSGDDNKITREYVISKVKEEKVKIIIVATQVIEAGVDIDMDLGFKDISTLDSEEQFLGRINRSCLKLNLKYKPKVYFFNKDDENKIYRNDYRLEDNLKKEEFQTTLLNKDFKSFYTQVFKRIKNNDKKIESGVLGNFENFEEKVSKLNYKYIKEKMQLIKNDSFRLFFPFKFEIPDYEIEEFKNKEKLKIYLDEEGKLDGLKVWNEFSLLNDIENYAKKKIKRSELNSLMQFFTFNIFKYYDGHRPFIGEEMYGYYFVENLDYITDDGKFNRKKFNEDSNSQFL